MKIKDCMCNNVKWVTPNTNVCDCAKVMSDNKIGCVPVCDEKKEVVGIVTDRDVILRTIACDKDCKNTPVSEIMTTNVCLCNANSEIEEAEKLMSQNAIRRLPVIENNKIVGIITLGNLFQNKNINSNHASNTFENICDCHTRNSN
jgi:CBS domain-containing protein